MTPTDPSRSDLLDRRLSWGLVAFFGLAYLFGSNYEVAFRYDDWDDDDETTRYNVGLNRYIDGHDIKWQLNYSTGKSDKNKENENDVIALGIAVGF